MITIKFKDNKHKTAIILVDDRKYSLSKCSLEIVNAYFCRFYEYKNIYSETCKDFVKSELLAP